MPERLPEPWRERWAADAEHHRQSPIPDHLDDATDAGIRRHPADDAAEARARTIADDVLQLVLPRLRATVAATASRAE